MKIITIDVVNNWTARVNQEPVKRIFEFSLFTDAKITGHIPFVTNKDCPYELFNTMTLLDKNVLLPRISLRIFYHLTYGYQFNNVKIYHYKTETDFENERKIKEIEKGIIIIGNAGSYRCFSIENGSLGLTKNLEINFTPLNDLDAIQGELSQSIKNDGNVAAFLSNMALGFVEPFELEIFEQIAIILSLILGIRLKAGAMNRKKEIDTNNLDPFDLGEPVNYRVHENPSVVSFLSNPEMPILPSATRTINLNSEIKFFHKIRFLENEDAIAFMRAAKLYRDALWLIESEPSLSWIMLVSAIEAMAKQWVKSEGLTFETLKNRHLAMEDLCGNKKGLIEIEGKKKKHSKIAFVAFILYHFPEEPRNRPSVGDSIGPWNDEGNILDYILEIYERRSSALHEGIIFPKIMCQSPLFRDPPAEKAASILCVSEKNLMLISTFEYVVKGSLLKWLEKYPGSL